MTYESPQQPGALSTRVRLPRAPLQKTGISLSHGRPQFGHVAIVRLLLELGEDPNRFNPQGAHSHSTPLHQAAVAGHGDTVRLLIEHGARLDIKDILWNGTPADWADHAGHPEIAACLRASATRRP